MSYTLCIDPVGERLEAGQACEAAVFLEAYGNTLDQLKDEYGPYEAASVFVVVLDDGGDAVGAVRLIMPGHGTVKSIVDISGPPWAVDGVRSAQAAGLDLARTWDVATVAVRRAARRGGLVSGALYHGLVQTLRLNRAGWIVMIMDLRARRIMDIAGLHSNVLPGTGPGSYLGSAASVPLWSKVSSMIDGQRSINPEAHRLISMGLGLDEVALPRSQDFVVRPRPHETAKRESGVVAPAGGGVPNPSTNHAPTRNIRLELATGI